MITYKKLEKLLQERDMTWKDLTQGDISVNMPAKFQKNKIVNTDTIDKVCKFLHVQPGDIMNGLRTKMI